jgi:hypothetical protein
MIDWICCTEVLWRKIVNCYENMSIIKVEILRECDERWTRGDAEIVWLFGYRVVGA